jgi:dihydrofolate reductase
MAKDSRVIGVDGTLPWKQSLDRQIFKNLTRNGVLIVGRRTLQEECTGSLDHVRHAKHCVVVSTTLSDVNELWGNAGGNQIEERDRDWKMLRVAASLGEALHIANRLSVDSVESQVNEPSLPQLSSPQSPFKSDLMCWVAGGERLFEEALKHPSAKEVHLSIVNVDVDTTNIPVANVAKFPAKYRWDHNYKPVFIETFENREDFQPDEPTFSYQVFQRIERNKPQ